MLTLPGGVETPRLELLLLAPIVVACGDNTKGIRSACHDNIHAAMMWPKIRIAAAVDSASSRLLVRLVGRQGVEPSFEVIDTDEDFGSELAAREIASATCIVHDCDADAEEMCGGDTANRDRGFCTGHDTFCAPVGGVQVVVRDSRHVM